MKAEQELLNEAFGNESFKQQTLENTLGYLRGRARSRRILATSAAAVILIVLFVWLLPSRRDQLQLRASAPRLPEAAMVTRFETENAPVVPGTSIRVLSDEELMRMLPDRAMAIVGTGEDRQLVFLDTQRQSTKNGS